MPSRAAHEHISNYRVLQWLVASMITEESQAKVEVAIEPTDDGLKLQIPRILEEVNTTVTVLQSLFPGSVSIEQETD